MLLGGGDNRLLRLDVDSLKYVPTTIEFPMSDEDLKSRFAELHAYGAGFLGVLWQSRYYLVDLNSSTIKEVYGKLIDAKQPQLYLHKVGDDVWGCGIKGGFHSHSLKTGKENLISLGGLTQASISCKGFHLGSNGLWVLSSERIYLFNTKTQSLKDVIDIKGATSLVEAGGHLWVFSENNLISFDLESRKRFVVKLDKYGIPLNNGFMTNYNDKQDNKLYLPTMNGLVKIDLNGFKQPAEQLEINFRDFKLFNKGVEIGGRSKDVKADASIEYATKIQLNHTQNMFQLDFVSNSFTNVRDIRFRYRLKGVNTDWIETDSDNAFALYSGVTDGRYIFQVQATRDKDNWPTVSKELELTLLPPWWRTWWAYLFYGISVFLMVFIFFNQFLKRKIAEKDKQTAQEIATAKEDLFANISHEFRTPLTLILGPSSAIGKRTNDKKTKYEIALIERNALRLLSMVDQILDLARLRGDKKQERELQDVTEIVNFVGQSYQSMADEKRIELVIKKHTYDVVYVSMLPDALIKIVTNLVSNAFKFTNTGGRVILSIEKDQQAVLIEVKDTGCGIKQDDLTLIFERFTRLESAVDPVSGSGIGLALVKQLVESHDGTIEVNSELGIGSCFAVRLPYFQSSDKDVHPLSLNSQNYVRDSLADLVSDISINQDSGDSITELENTHKQSVLIIEDNRDMQRYLIELLSQQYQCFTASDGEEGVEKAKQIVPDIIISDLMMPKMNGFEVAQTLKAEVATNHIPLILLTAKGDKQSRIRGWKENADEYLTKPFDSEELIHRVKNLLSIRELLQQQFVQRALVSDTASPYLSTVHDSNQNSDLSVEQQFVHDLNKAVMDRVEDENLKVSTIAETMNLTERQLLRKIKAILNSTPSGYIRNIRFEKATNLLKLGQPVSVVTYSVGFTSQSYFGKCFKARYNVTPTEYLKKNEHP